MVLKMWVVAVGILIVLVGCRGVTPQQSLEGLDVSSKAPGCVRECTQTYSGCIQNSSMSGGNRLIANDLIRACGGALRLCCDTCPNRQS